ncbi:hypothetical protein AB0J74_25330 [Asanoa sp. NPDC049573]|uniref:hypothetical protein n=1 Tax=Asanoa sp. NPDC049573 TaxID=3155396 RepID=UPI0034390DF4
MAGLAPPPAEPDLAEVDVAEGVPPPAELDVAGLDPPPAEPDLAEVDEAEVVPPPAEPEAAGLDPPPAEPDLAEVDVVEVDPPPAEPDVAEVDAPLADPPPVELGEPAALDPSLVTAPVVAEPESVVADPLPAVVDPPVAAEPDLREEEPLEWAGTDPDSGAAVADLALAVFDRPVAGLVAGAAGAISAVSSGFTVAAVPTLPPGRAEVTMGAPPAGPGAPLPAAGASVAGRASTAAGADSVGCPVVCSASPVGRFEPATDGATSWDTGLLNTSRSTDRIGPATPALARWWRSVSGRRRVSQFYPSGRSRPERRKPAKRSKGRVPRGERGGPVR